MLASHNLSTARQLLYWAWLLLDLVLASHLVIGFVRRVQAGRVLFDLGRIDENLSTLKIVWGVLWILLGSLGVLLVHTHDLRWALYTFFLLQGVLNIVVGMQRFLICEAGILSSRIKLYRWEDILCYDLEKEKLRLKLRDKSLLGERWITCRTGVCLDYQEELDAVLASRCPKLSLPVEV
jgi:hypothetical protein